MGSIAKFLKDSILGIETPCYILNKEPLIMVSYFSDFHQNLEQIASKIDELSNNLPVYVFFQLGWQVENKTRIDEVRTGLNSIIARCPEVNFTFLTNSPLERENILSLKSGVDAIFCHQNAFIDEHRYGIKDKKKKYDAIYLARITPFKRHELAADIQSLKLIGAHKTAEESHYQKIRKLLAHADYQEKVWSYRVSDVMSEAEVGLCLSQEEGAMFVSTEYLLSGIPIVTTRNMGGRNHLMPAECYLEVDDDPKSVSIAVQALKDKQLNPQRIRALTIELMEQHRRIFRDRLNTICNEHTGKSFTGMLPHKLCLRMRVPLTLKRGSI